MLQLGRCSYPLATLLVAKHRGLLVAARRAAQCIAALLMAARSRLNEPYCRAALDQQMRAGPLHAQRQKLRRWTR